MKTCNHKRKNESGECKTCAIRERFADPEYRNNKVCRKGHKGYNTSGNCIECERIRKGKIVKKESKIIRKFRELQSLLNPSKPCKHGHTGERGKNGQCLECDRIRSKKRQERMKNNKSMRDALPPCVRCGKKDRNDRGKCIKCQKEARRVANSNRRALAAGAIGTLTVDQWESVKKRANGRCYFCGEQRALTIDHIIPLSRGGTNTISNIQPLCLSCNSIKMQDDTNFMK